MTYQRTIEIVPSILSADFARLGDQVREAEEGGAGRIQVDVMDGHFVPNITVGPVVIKSIRRHTTLPIEAHLMIDNPEDFIDEFIAAGADYIILHVEADDHLHRTIHQIRSQGAKPGVAINPSTSLASIEEILAYIDMVIVMTVNPGFGGQEFIGSMIPKIWRLRAMIEERELECDIEVDGGIHEETAPLVVEAGANLLVAGSAVYGQEEGVAASIERLKASVRGLQYQK